MSAVTKVNPTSRRRLGAERRLVIRGATWDDYLELVDSLHEHTPLRVAFDGKDMEIMTKGRYHEQFSFLIAQLIVAVAQAQGAHVEPFGETTWRKPGVKRSLEADQWFFFDAEKRERLAQIYRADRGRGSRTSGTERLPSPDLAIEVDISPPKVDRRGIYAALGVAELWRFDGQNVVMEQLNSAGLYEPCERSIWLQITPAEVLRWLVDDDTTDFIPWLNRVTKWARRKSARRMP